ncbi:coniferyl aldehyde dehydrogenase [Sessilibacter corallicola]|uniref:coniferyl aldehyde dehydrogenase n=1 Tax=Sessilibacter corallicola TaxID=2904075 RepID=UPI001E518F27|nr:coniferyl aldehyde dehydrogenase [Sessilibacter corallicola]MCE2030184.1 coniferyl aldehyde dehydrogenase [Sessilibacter corallicola]
MQTLSDHAWQTPPVSEQLSRVSVQPSTVSSSSSLSEQPALANLFYNLKRAAEDQPFPSYQERIHHLRQLKKQIQRYQDLIATVIGEDYGWRSPTESKMLDALAPILEVNHALHSLKRWMKPQKRRTELLFLSNSLQVRYQPKGVVGIICPWNVPLYLSLGPLIASLAAGNRAMIKMPPNCPRTAELLTQMLAEIFPEDLVCVVDGNHPQAMEISHLPFDHLIFTGSANSGRQIMANAAANLTPVTLELGGKSPAIITPGFSLVSAAKSIAHGKGVNSGQVCVAPDYVLLPSGQTAAFIEEIKRAFTAMYPSLDGNEDYTAIVNDAQEQRFLTMLEDARQNGAQIDICAADTPAEREQESDNKNPQACRNQRGKYRQYPLHVVSQVSADMQVAKQELFGPMLLVFEYQDLSQALAHVNQGPRPLACYIFSNDQREQQYILQNTHSGGVTINDCGWQVMNHDAPFGGIGASGTGSYHGIEGFRELSHGKTVFKKHRFFPMELFHPPYGKKIQQLTLRFFLGQADSEVKLKSRD